MGTQLPEDGRQRPGIPVCRFPPVLIPEDSVTVTDKRNPPGKQTFVLRFNKQMNGATLTKDSVLVTKVGGGDVPSYKIVPISPLRFQLSFDEALDPNADYEVKVSTAVKDSLNNSLAAEQKVTFHSGNKK
ncbi:Ig-like domain-containing protein [Paenibacillus sp. CC-CFT747]|nr:Ig-like domain-containing protein [Paenibacillus sp. CC-CFT747]